MKTDPAFANPAMLASGVGYARPVGRGPDHLFLAIQSGSSVVVQRFDLAAGTLDPTALFTLPGGIMGAALASVEDATNLYLAVTDLSGTSRVDSVWRLPLSATATSSAVQLSAEAAGSVIVGVLLATTGKVAYDVRAGSGLDHVAAVDKAGSGTSPGAVLVAEPPAGASLALLAAAGDKVFYETQAASGARTACAVAETGAAVLTQSDGSWVAFLHPTARSLVTGSEPETGLLATGAGATGSLGGAALGTVTLATGASGTGLGTLPADLVTFDRARWIGTRGLLRGFLTGAMYGDVLFADAASAGSLTRVTSTPTINEFLPLGP